MNRRYLARLAVALSLLCTMTPARAIVCGEEVRTGEMPWLVQVVELRHNGQAYHGDGALVCSGSLLDDRTIITAAHCFAKAKPENLGVIVWTKNGASVPYRVSSRRALADRPEADVAVLLLTKNIENATPANWSSPGVGDTESGSTLIAGWGVVWPRASASSSEVGSLNCPIAEKTKGGGPPHHGAVDLLAVDRCSVKERGGGFASARTMICAQGPETRPTGICSGDSGGPLLRVDDAGRGTLIAVASQVPGLHRTSPAASCIDNPGLFTTVAPLIGSIQAAMAELLKSLDKAIAK